MYLWFQRLFVVEMCNVREGWQPLTTQLGINLLQLVLINYLTYRTCVVRKLDRN